MKDVLSAILKLREEKGWSEYMLAERSGLPQSTISSWYCKNASPTVASLQKICAAFGITMSQLFATGGDPVILTENQVQLLRKFSALTPQQQNAVFTLIDQM